MKLVDGPYKYDVGILKRKNEGESVACKVCGRNKVTLYKLQDGTYICKDCKEKEK